MAQSYANGSSDASPESSTTASDQLIQKSFSCVLCASRKVKCDRRPGGCENCTKARVPCLYKAPPPPRRRKKGARDVDATTRLRLYEEALRQLGVDPEELVRQKSSKNAILQDVSGINGFLENRIPDQTRSSYRSSEVGVLVSEEGKSRYLENGLWTSLKGEFREPRELLDDSSDDEVSEGFGKISVEPPIIDGTGLILGGQVLSTDLRSLHPQPVQSFKLWQSYLDNINPLVKIFHAPTVQQLISNATGDLDDVPRNVEALLFAIYCITTESLSDGECIAILGQSKSAASQRFRFGAQHALIKSSFLRTSDIMVLQAFTLFILSLQNGDAQVIWILAGVAQRIGQRIGLHRDGELLKLSPFETEIRRRLWWSISMLEGFSQKLAGTGTSNTVLMGDVEMPSNINDSDVSPGMKEPPKDHKGATEMMFFLIRCLVGQFLKRSADGHTTFDGVWHRLTTSVVQLAIKDKAIDELEALIDDKFLKYCDPSITWHLMCTHLGKAIVFMMRFMAHSTDYYNVDTAQNEKDLLFDLALQVGAAQNLVYTMKELQGFMWHVNLHFQWKAFIYLLSELRYRTEGAKVDQAWKEIEKTYEFHPSFDKDLSVRALPVALSNLTLKAWEAYIAARGIPTGGEPYFIQLIRSRRNRKKSPSSRTGQSDTIVPPQILPTAADHESKIDVNEGVLLQTNSLQTFDWNTADLNASLDWTSSIPDMVPLEYPEQMNWSTWDSLLVDYQTHTTNDVPTDLLAFNFGPQQ
ncbi:Nn.00g107890.m01.CDS01 [Neocucurbitaria sp. VM-36]